MLLKRSLGTIALLGVLQICAASAQTPAELTADYLAEAQRVQRSYFLSSDPADRDRRAEFILDGALWIGEMPGDGLLDVMRVTGLYGAAAETLRLQPTVMKGDAARVAFSARYQSAPGIEWMGRADLIRIDQSWRFKNIAWTGPRVLAANPTAAVTAYVDHMQQSLTRVDAPDTNFPIEKSLAQDLAYGAGYWQPRGGNAVGIYGHLRSVEPDRVQTRFIEGAADSAQVLLRTEKDRRTTTQVFERRLTLARDPQLGWHIVSATEIADESPTPPEPANQTLASADMPAPTEPIDMVRQLLAAVSGPGANAIPPQKHAETFRSWFGDDANARRGLGVVAASLPRFSAGEPATWALSEPAEGIVRAELQEGSVMLRTMMPALEFSFMDTIEGKEITNVVVKR